MGRRLSMSDARKIEGDKAGSGAHEVCKRLYESVLRENYPDAKRYTAMLDLQTRRRILDIVFEEVKYDKGTRANCHRDEKLYWLLGITPVRGGGRPGTGAVKYVGSKTGFRAEISKHLMVMVDAYTVCNIDERQDNPLWRDWGFSSYVVNYNWGCEVHIDGGNKGLSYGEGFGDYEGGNLILFDRHSSMFTEVKYYRDSLIKCVKETGEPIRDENGNVELSAVSRAGRKLERNGGGVFNTVLKKDDEGNVIVPHV